MQNSRKRRGNVAKSSLMGRIWHSSSQHTNVRRNVITIMCKAKQNCYHRVRGKIT